MPHTPVISAKVEVLVIEYDAILRMSRTKKFRQLRASNYAEWLDRADVYTDRMHELATSIDAIVKESGGKVHLWEGLVGKAMPIL
jgi:hypothetical protein